MKVLSNGWHMKGNYIARNDYYVHGDLLRPLYMLVGDSHRFYALMVKTGHQCTEFKGYADKKTGQLVSDLEIFEATARALRDLELNGHQ